VHCAQFNNCVQHFRAILQINNFKSFYEATFIHVCLFNQLVQAIKDVFPSFFIWILLLYFRCLPSLSFINKRLMVPFLMAQRPNEGLGHLTVNAPRSHTDTQTPSSTPTNELLGPRRYRHLHNPQQTQQMNIHALRGFETLLLTTNQLHTYTLDRKTTWIGCVVFVSTI
jgi:hypothetical protein